MLRKIGKVLSIFVLGVFCALVIPATLTVSAIEVDGSGSGAGGINTETCYVGYCWATSAHFNNTPSQGASAEGIRLSIVDKNGNKVSGTKSHDYFRSGIYNLLKNTKETVYYNKHKENYGNKNSVVSYQSGALRTVKFVKSDLFGASKMDLPRVWPNDGERATNTRVLDYLTNMARNNSASFLKMLKNDLNYDYYNQKNADDHFLEFEPITAMVYNNGERYYVGTVTELMAFVWNMGKRTDNGLGMLYGLAVAGSRALYLSSAGNTNGGFNSKYISESDPVIEYASQNPSGINYNLNILNRLFSGNGDTPNPYGHGILWFYEILPKCDWNNPDHFQDTNGDGTPDSGPGGVNCCTDASITGSHSKDEIEFAYPICGTCDVRKEEPSASTPACGTDGNSKDHTFTDTVSWDCVYRDPNEHNSYRIGNVAGNSYCTVYCTESTTLQLPASYQGFVPVRTSFIWPNSSAYSLKVSGTRQCKVKFDYMNWLDDYNSASSSTRTSLMNKLNECASDTILNNNRFSYQLEPTISISGYTGYMNGRDKNESVQLVEKNNNIEVSMYDVSYSGSVSNATISESGLRNFALSLWNNKLFTTSTSNQYVLPNDLYSYTNKQTGIISYRKPADADSDESTDGTEKYTNRGYGSWAVDDSTIPSDANRKIGNEITITYKGISASNNESHFDGYAKNYTCQYNVERSNVAVCDYQNPEQFLDLDGDGEPDSGPNGENCCNHFLVQFEGDEEKIAELLEKYPICNVDNGNTKCDYNNPSQYVGAPYGTSPGKGPNGTNCCEDLRDNYLSYGLSYAQFQELEQKYGCDSGNGPDPEGTCTPIPTVNDKSCCSDPAYADYPVCQYEGGIPVLYREISLSHPFLSEDGSTRDPGDNWQSKNNYLVSKYITNNRGVKEDLVYQEEPMYVFELDSATIQEIRAENKGHKFDEFELTCTNGGNCISTFFEKYLSGTAATCTSDKGHDISRCDKD